MKTLRELQDFAVQENIGSIAGKTVEDIEELAKATIILPNLSEFSLISQIPPFPFRNSDFKTKYSKV